MSLYALILAGGSGARLWPMSTKSMPKQFLTLFGTQSMLQETTAQVAPLIPLEKTYVATQAAYGPIVQRQLPALPPSQIILEPPECGTAIAVGLAATLIASLEPTAVMVSCAADLFFADGEALRQALRFAEMLAREGHLVALGIVPTTPETGYGYIQVGEVMRRQGSGLAAHKALEFREKPSREVAETYLRQGDYVWNTGVFIWRVDRILDEIRQHMPGVAPLLDAAARSSAQGHGIEAVHDVWAQLRELHNGATIEVAVVEKASNIAVIPLDMGWADLGNWAQIAARYPPDEHQNRSQIARPGRQVTIDTTGTFIYSAAGRIIATVGIADLIIVDTGHALLVCHKDYAHRVREVAEVAEVADALEGEAKSFSADE